jgi:hypothetical protein
VGRNGTVTTERACLRAGGRVDGIRVGYQTGYVFAKQLADVDDDTASQHFTSPAEALAWQKAHEGITTSIPIYAPDGATKICTFTIGGNRGDLNRSSQ